MNKKRISSIKVGKVIKISSKNTVVVLVESHKQHKRYKKMFKISKKYLVHYDEKTNVTQNMTVKIRSCRPISKRKSWCLDKVVI